MFSSARFKKKKFPTSLEISKHLVLFPHKRGKGDKNIYMKHIRNAQHKNLLYLKYWHNFLLPPPKTHKTTDDKYIAMYIIVSSYHVTAEIRKGMPFISRARAHTHTHTHTHTHKTHLFMSVLKDGCQSWQQIINGRCQFFYTNDIHNYFQCWKNATQNFWLLLTQIFIQHNT